MPRDGDATRARILAAATSEFAAHGIAGARVDRIAANAQANKAQLYAYFGSKEELFDRIYADAAEKFVTDFPIDATDLPGFAVRLYDAWIERPEVVRLQTWARLERTQSGHLLESASRERAYQLPAIAAQQKAGHVRADIRPEDLVAMLLALSATWAANSTTIVAAREEPARVHTRRRSALRTAVEDMIRPA